MSTPIVPPRPARNQAGLSPVKDATPTIPPRPVRSGNASPDRETYTRSPFNTLPGAVEGGYAPPASHRSSQELPRRPPSVSLPSIGQEGSEYSSYDQLPDEAHGVAAERTTSVSPDLPMHQPRASLPQSTAKRQIQTVTRTDSASAAAVGIGKGPSTDDLHAGAGFDAASPMARSTSQTHNQHHHHSSYGNKRAASTDRHPLHTKASFNRSTSSLVPMDRTTSRPSSIYGDDYELGIPVIGQQIPLNPMAGDVQAPSPGPGHSQHAPGIGFFNDGSQRAQARRKSSRQEFGPPGSYGMYHDQDHQDKFEKAWVAKHPEAAAREESFLHLPRPPSALTSAQLNELVGQSGSGMGTSATAIGTPDEATAFEVSKDYANRLTSPVKSPTAEQAKAPRASSLHRRSLSGASYQVGDEYDHVYHVTPPTLQPNKVTGGGEADGKVDLGPHAAQEDGWINEHGDGAPILASDEILKRPGSAYMHAAVAPEHHDDSYDSDHSRRNSVQPPSRPSSRPSSVHGGYHGGSLHRYVSHEEPHYSGPHTPLEEIEEYEPLFPEDEKEDEKPRAFKKRPELAMHHFPSQDVWEDTPASLQYMAEVSTPDLEREQESLEADTAAATFETPADEQKRRDQNPDDMTSDKKTLVKPRFKPGVLEETHRERPGVQRFPSSDVWEDTPESVYLETTVNAPQMDDSMAQPEETPTIGALEGVEDKAHATTGLTGIRPTIPSRPERKSKLDLEVKPGTDDVQPAARTKPIVPARPLRSVRPDQADQGTTAPAVPKTKPLVPARPGGEKIAAMKAGFMNDLNNRLRLGPQGPPPKKEAEPEVNEEQQKAPLADARKSRARGPTRRKPGTSAVAEFKASTFAMSPLVTVWSIDEEDELQVQPEKKAETEAPVPPPTQETQQALAANEAANTAEPTFAAPKDIVSAVGAEGDAPDPSISAAAVHEQAAVAPELKASLAQAEEPPSSFEAREQDDLHAAAAQPSVAVTASSGDQE